mmetsp:Transcript_63540/g.137596  ORF Transcript_63540/g.137596 Transcript_63540/m.137596 type:complete len:243 (+) Transcript_63540:3-731(+)
MRKTRSRSREPKVKNRYTAHQANEAAEGGSDSEGFIPMTEEDRLECQRWCERYQAELRDRHRAQTAAKEKVTFGGRDVQSPCPKRSHSTPQASQPLRVQLPQGQPQRKASQGLPAQPPDDLLQGQPQHRVLVNVAEKYSGEAHPGFEAWYSSRNLPRMPATCDLPTPSFAQESFTDEAADVLGDIPTWGLPAAPRSARAEVPRPPRRRAAAARPPREAEPVDWYYNSLVRHWPSLEDEVQHS